MPKLLRVCALSLVAVFSGCGGAAVSTLEFVEIVPKQPKLGEVLSIKFRVLDYRGLPQAGSSVTFKLQSENKGVTLSPPSGTTEKGSGIVEAQLVASARVTSVIVVATAGDKTVLTPPISFAGGAANGRQFTFQCGSVSGAASGGLHALGAYDPDRYLIAGVKAECFAHVADRNGDGVPGALVSFLTEAGTIGPTETSQADVVGNAKILYKTSYPLPVPTDPAVFSWTPTCPAFGPSVEPTKCTSDFLVPLWMEAFRWTNNPVLNFAMTPNLQEPRRKDPLRAGLNITLNPRDNLVSMIAVTSGEEGFTDSNNNGKYDDPEPYDDLTEPFVDNNDNLTWDEGERYVDLDSNGKWDGKNQKWDANTTIWVQERLLWTGIPSDKDAVSAEPIIRVIDPVGPIYVPFLSFYGYDDPMYPGYRIPSTAKFLLADPWFNSIAQNSEGDGCEIGSNDDKSPVNAVPKKVNSGFKFTYPPYAIIQFGVRDARDPNTPPINQVPKRTPPIDFGVPLFCKFTASQLGGHIFGLDIGTIRGKVE